MKPKRNKPAIGLTLDADVHAWILEEAIHRRLKPAQFVNSILAAEMLRQPVDVLHQTVTVHGNNTVTVHAGKRIGGAKKAR